MIVKENFDLTELNTFRVKTKAKLFVSIEHKDEIPEAYRLFEEQKLKPFILGKGSNVLFVKDEIDAVVFLSFDSISHEIDGKNVWLNIDAGKTWDDVVEYAVNRKFWGIENLSGIPGTAGAAPVQNIGAYGTEISDTLDFIEGYDLQDFKMKKLQKKECKFSYRDSIFKNDLKNKFIITNIRLKLAINGKPNFSYKDLKEKFGNRTNAEISEIRKAILEIRNSKLPKPEIIPNAGSFFKNPVVTSKKFDELKKSFPSLKSFNYEREKVKLSAAQLIDLSKANKFSVGNAMVYENHSLVIVNKGNASGREILILANKIKNTVFEKFGISLQFEVNIIE